MSWLWIRFSSSCDHIMLPRTPNRDRRSGTVFKRTTKMSQALTLLVGCVAIVYHKHVDTAIDYLWREILHKSPYFRHDSFEVVLSTLLFAVYLTGWIILDYYVPGAHAFRITDNTAQSSNDSWKGRESALVQETLWYTLPWLIFDIMAPRRHLLLELNVNSPTALRIGRDLLLSFILYDFIFFIGHFSMHRNRYLLSSVHSKHHTMGT
jgi:hypothetical protein